MGNYIRPLSDAVFTIASDDLWIESLAIQQLHTTANLPNMQRVVGMPDLHPGRGYPIGAAFFSVGRFYPALVGNDIGCGMALWQTDILTRKYNADKFEKRLSDLDDVAEESWLEENLPSAFAQHPWRSSLGSIGGGNHFAELQQVDQIINAELFALPDCQVQYARVASPCISLPDALYTRCAPIYALPHAPASGAFFRSQQAVQSRSNHHVNRE